MWRFWTLLFLLGIGSALAQSVPQQPTVEQLFKEQLGEAAFSLTMLRFQLEQSKGQLTSCQAIVAERDRQLKEKETK
jgi:hypothetical protein